MLDSIIQKKVNAEEQVLIKVLEQYLGRTPTEEDYKKCSKIIRQGFDNTYCFCYDKIALGDIEWKFQYENNPLMATVTFTPLPVLN